MGSLDQINQAMGATAGPSGGGKSAFMQAALQMLTSNGSGGGNGLAGLVNAFQAKGLGTIITSWIGTGPNLPISAEQIQHALGADQVQHLAAQAGVSPEVACTELAGLLPGLVDKLSPDGKIPEGGLLQQGLNMLKDKLG